jgi:hypothetical protein
MPIEEIRGCRSVQCLLLKKHDWEPEPDDQDFERDSRVFLTGVGGATPDSNSIGLSPQRHVSTILTALIRISETSFSHFGHILTQSCEILGC